MSLAIKRKRQDRVSGRQSKSQEDTSKLHKLCDVGNVAGVTQYIEKLNDEELAAKLSTRKGVFGYTPLHLAVARGHTEVLGYLLDKSSKVTVNCRANSGYTPLHIAASNGHKRCIKMLLDYGANITAKDEYGRTPKQSAQLSSKTNIVRLLRSEEIIREVENNGSKLTELLQQELDELEPDCLSRALIAATKNNNASIIGKLLVKGAINYEECLEIAITEKKPHSQAMLLLVKAATTGNKSIIQKLFGESVSNPSSLDPKEFSEDQFTHVKEALHSGRVSTVVPIDIARKNGNFQVREEMLIKTDVSKEAGYVFWHGMRLVDLEVSWLRRVSWVKRLRLAKNGFKTLPYEMGSHLKQVVKLDLQHNELSLIPRCLLELPSLGELNLAHNYLREIPDVPEWSPCLTVLDLSFNHLTSLPNNVIAPALKSLNLSHNLFKQVPLCICSLTTLQNLNLSENQDILQLPAEMGRLTQLSRLGLSGLKDLTDPPRSLLKDPKDCIRYLNSKLRCAKGFYKMKLMLVGQANRGKTTLVARLQGKDCGNESTVGVDVSEWVYKPSLGKNKFYFSIWDFGGQEEYYATHQCFLSEKSLYLLLFNLKDGESGVSELKPWLNNITLRAPNSLVIIVGTHLDEVSDDEREGIDEILQQAAEMAGAFKKLNVAQVLPVGLTGRIENIGLLKEAIYDHAAEYTGSARAGQGLPIMGRKIPSSYHALDKKLETVQEKVRQNQSEPIMTSEQFKTFVFDMNLPDLQRDDDELKTATLFLTDIGSLLHYDDKTHNLNDLYFIDPRWLCDMMAKVVTIRQRNPFVKNGILHSKDIRFLFRDKRFPWEHFEQYLALLDRFEIALPLDNMRILIPSMLPATHPEEVDKECEHLVKKPMYTRYIIFTEATTPPGFWSRLLSRIMHSVQKVSYALDRQAAACESEPQDSQLLDGGETLSATGVISPEIKEPQMSADGPNSSISSSNTQTLRQETISSPQLEHTPDIPLTLPHFPAQLPISLKMPYATSDIKLYYWREGLLYKDPEVVFRIESLSRSGGSDGVLLVASPTNQGRQIIGQLVDIVLALIQEWYPGIGDTSGPGIDQKVLCIECMKLDRFRPFAFQVDQCLKLIAKNETSSKCNYYKNSPHKNHTVPLTEVVPDLLLQDIEAKFILKKEDISYEENERSLLGKGGYGKVYRGKCHGKPVAIKTYLSSKEESFIELRQEARLLQRSYHPCFVCLEGVLMFPMMALVLELAPLGSLAFPLLKKQVPIHRLTFYRIALEVAAALRFIHQQGIIFRDLKADNVLLWTLDPESLCHCKITDFGIATHLSPVGVKGLKGTKGFIAPEVLHVDKRKQRSGYNHKADTFSFAMLLYQMIARRHPFHDVQLAPRVDAYIENGERPKLLDVNHAHNAFHYLTQLMKTCWKDNPKSRPEDKVILSKLCLPVMQSVMAVTPIKSLLSARKAIAITVNEIAEAGNSNQLNSELWVCCDGPEGAEINMYNTHTMTTINITPVKDNQVHAVIKCNGYVWIGFRAGIEYSVVDIFSIEKREHVHNIRMRDISVICMACTTEAVYIGTLEGYCFQFPSGIDKVRTEAGNPVIKQISRHAIDGIACTDTCVWVSSSKNIYFVAFHNLNLLGSIQQVGNARIGQLSLSPNGQIVWSAYLHGGKVLTAWDAREKFYSSDIKVSQHLVSISAGTTEEEGIITAMVPAEDCVWVGMATGHILVFSEEDLLTWFHPYTEYVRFLAVLPCSGLCEKEKCMVASGGKGFQSMIEDLDQTIDDKVDEKGQVIHEDYNSKGGFLVLWEAFSSGMYRQMNLIEQNISTLFNDHESVRQIILEGGFVDGTNMTKKDVEHTSTSYESDLQALPYVYYSDETGAEAPKSMDSGSEVPLSSSPASNPDHINSDQASDGSDDVFNEASDDILSLEQSYASSSSKFRQRLTTVVSCRVRKSTHNVFEVKLVSTNQIIRITCRTPPQLSAVLTQLQVNATVSEDKCKLFYCIGGNKVHIQSQEQFLRYLQFQKPPQLWLETSN